MSDLPKQFSLNGTGSLCVWDGVVYCTKTGRVVHSFAEECKHVSCFDKTNAVAVVPCEEPFKVHIVDLVDDTVVTAIAVVGEVVRLEVHGLLLAVVCQQKTDGVTTHHLYVYQFKEGGPFGPVEEVHHSEITGFDYALCDTHVAYLQTPDELVRQRLGSPSPEVVQHPAKSPLAPSHTLTAALSANGSVLLYDAGQGPSMVRFSGGSKQTLTPVKGLGKLKWAVRADPPEAENFITRAVHYWNTYVYILPDCNSVNKLPSSLQQVVSRGAENEVLTAHFPDPRTCELEFYTYSTGKQTISKQSRTLTIKKDCIPDPNAE